MTPYMKSTMHALALAGKCGFLGGHGTGRRCIGFGAGRCSGEKAIFGQEGGQGSADEAAG